MKNYLTILALFSLLATGYRPPAEEQSAASVMTATYCPDLPDGTLCQLQLKHSFGIFTLEEKVKNSELIFLLPAHITRHAGLLTLVLSCQNVLLNQADLEILPVESGTVTVESYFGPKHLPVASGNPAMLVMTLLDSLDNPLPPGPEIDLAFSAYGKTAYQKERHGNLYAYRNFYAGTRSGTGTVSAAFRNRSTEAYRVDFYVHDLRPFRVSTEREHPYADGAQPVKLVASGIKDQYGNLAADGTLVNFRITEDDNTVSFASAKTFRGRAEAMRYAPFRQSRWQVTAQVGSVQAANTSVLTFLPSVKDFTVDFRPELQMLTAGPVIGFQQQYVKNGMPVKVTVTDHAGKEQQLNTVITNGFARLKISGKREEIKEITVSISGITKKVQLQ